MAPARSVYDENKNLAPGCQDIGHDASEQSEAKVQGRTQPDPTSRGDTAELRMDS